MLIWYNIYLFLVHRIIASDQGPTDNYSFHICYYNKISSISTSKLKYSHRFDSKSSSNKKEDRISFVFELISKKDVEVPVNIKVDLTEQKKFDNMKDYFILDLYDIVPYCYMVNIKELKDVKDVIYLKFYDEEGLILFYLEIVPWMIEESLQKLKFITGSIIDKESSKILRKDEITLKLDGKEEKFFIIDQDDHKINLLKKLLESYKIDSSITECHLAIKTKYLSLFGGFNELLKEHKFFFEKHKDFYDIWKKRFRNIVLSFYIGISELRYNLIVDEKSSDEVIYFDGSSLYIILEPVYKYLIDNIKITENDEEQIVEFESFKTSYIEFLEKLKKETEEFDLLIEKICSLKLLLIDVISEISIIKKEKTEKIKKFNLKYFDDLVCFSETIIDEWKFLKIPALKSETDFDDLYKFVNKVDRNVIKTIVFRLIISLKNNRGVLLKEELFKWNFISCYKIGLIVSEFERLNVLLMEYISEDEEINKFKRKISIYSSSNEKNGNIIANNHINFKKVDNGDFEDENINTMNVSEDKDFDIIKKREDSCKRWKDTFKRFGNDKKLTLKNLMLNFKNKRKSKINF